MSNHSRNQSGEDKCLFVPRSPRDRRRKMFDIVYRRSAARYPTSPKASASLRMLKIVLPVRAEKKIVVQETRIRICHKSSHIRKPDIARVSVYVKKEVVRRKMFRKAPRKHAGRVLSLQRNCYITLKGYATRAQNL